MSEIHFCLSAPSENYYNRYPDRYNDWFLSAPDPNNERYPAPYEYEPYYDTVEGTDMENRRHRTDLESERDHYSDSDNDSDRDSESETDSDRGSDSESDIDSGSYSDKDTEYRDDYDGVRLRRTYDNMRCTM